MDGLKEFWKTGIRVKGDKRILGGFNFLKEMLKRAEENGEVLSLWDVWSSEFVIDKHQLLCNETHRR